MSRRYANQRNARVTLCPGVASVEQIEQAIEGADKARWSQRKSVARRFSAMRAEFSRRFASRHDYPNNPARLSVEQMNAIRTHPQYVNPLECPPKARLFELDSSPEPHRPQGMNADS